MIVCIGDIHLGALDRWIPDAYIKVIDTVDRMITNSTKKGHVSDVVLLGDISDTSNLPDFMFIALMEMMLKHDVQWHILVGNHDHEASQKNALSVMKWIGEFSSDIDIVVYTKPKIVVLGDDRKYFMCPHPYVENMPENCRYAFGHFGYSGAKADNGYTLKTKHTPSGRWILGDYHTPQEGKNYQYAGSVAQTKRNESVKKGYIELDDVPRFVSWTPSIKIGSKIIESYSELKDLDPSVYWFISTTCRDVAPTAWATKYPHILRLEAAPQISKKARVLLKSVGTVAIEQRLPEWLLREGLSDKEIRKAVKEIM